ncbi:MAG: hypothetical protein DRG78_23870 [Epsilonproteobacteria bacterium]|nr:MAG: hypothetical protein DRG78_23870 [Campylobacterota bacterium]
MQNPFNFFSIATDKDFCNRDEDIKQLKSYISNSANIVLYSKRRYGKTTLLTELFQNHLENNIVSIYIDIYGINDKYTLIEKLSSKIVEYYKVTDITQTIKNLKSVFNRISFSLTINQKTAMPEIKPEFIKKDFEVLLNEILDNFQEFLVTKNKKAVIAIDEFQDILNITDINIEAILRSKIQFHTNISYIFTGSKQHMLTSMFNDNKKPFYTMATNYELKAINSTVFYNYTSIRLLKKELELSNDIFLNIYNLCDGETRMIQKIFYEIYERYQNITIDETIIEEIFDMLNLQNDSVYKLLCDNLTQNQIITLKIVSNNLDEILSKNISDIYNISQQSIKSALNSLLKKEIIYKQENNYIVYDKEFDFWLKSQEK